jgi:hypothetical protein
VPCTGAPLPKFWNFCEKSHRLPQGIGTSHPESGSGRREYAPHGRGHAGREPGQHRISVVGDLSQIGGSTTQGFFDDGTNGDVLAGNNVFSYGATVAAATIPGAKSLPVAIADAEERNGSTTIALTVSEPPAPPIEISEIQGAAHLSPRNGDTVTTTGVVIGKIGSSFYIQDPTPDANPETSDGLQVFGASARPRHGERVPLESDESHADRAHEPGRHGALERQSAAGTDCDRHRRAHPAEHGDRGRRERQCRGGGVLFDPAEDGLDFYESLEGMLVQMNDLVATSFTFTNFGEIFVVGDNGANATTITPRGGLVIGPGDLNPERIVIDDEWFKTGPPAMPVVNVGGTFPGAHVGIMDWAFGEYRIQLRSQPVVGSTSSSLPNGAGHERAPAAWGVPAEPIDFGTASLLPPPNPPTNGDQCGDQNAKSSVPCRKVINITC